MHIHFASLLVFPGRSGIIPPGKFTDKEPYSMTTETINQLDSFIKTQILKQPDRTIAPEEPLISGGLIDSFSLVDLALFVEETFNVRIDDTELNAETFDSLQQLAELIASRQG